MTIHAARRSTGLIRFGSVLACAALASACAGAEPQTDPAISDSKASSICQEVMGFDVSGQYYFKCRDYLKTHARPDIAPTAVKSESAEHKACHQIGLKDGTPEYGSCVETMYQYDIGSIHL